MVRNKLERQYVLGRIAGKVLNPVPGFKVSTPYHERGPLWSLGYHTGEDHACPEGTPVVAVTWGTVIGAGIGGSPHALGSDYGNVVIIMKATGDLEYFYAHLSKIKVKVGQKVRPGMVVGLSGMSGHATGPHVHFEARPLNGRFGSDVAPIRVKKRGGK
jgi:murein DD-endopeptidase MepM/ murein hydrolase activator NlpD